MSKIISQKKIFEKSEANAWYKRNKKANPEINSKIWQFYGNFIHGNVLEIGCSTGKSLNYFKENYDCECFGIDPSKSAIKDGKNLFKNISLCVGTSDILPYNDNFFDVVIFGFCLYLIDRTLLTKTIAEADRVLKDGGFICITDFDTKIPKQRPYRHFEGIMSYKMDYSKLFLAFPHYSTADKFCFSHTQAKFTEDIRERVAATVIYKSHLNAYIDEID